MKQSGFSENQITFALRQHGSGKVAEDNLRPAGRESSDVSHLERKKHTRMGGHGIRSVLDMRRVGPFTFLWVTTS